MSVVDGIVSGLDTTSVINQLLAVERAPITRLEAKQTELDRKRQAWTDIQRAIGTLRIASNTLAKESAFLTTTVRSSDSELATATARDGATPGTASFRVHQLATAHSVMTGAGVTSSSATTGAGRVAIAAGLEALGVTAISVDSGATARVADLTIAPAGSGVVEVTYGDDSVTVSRTASSVTVGGVTLTIGAGGMTDGTGRVQVLAPDAATTVAGFAASVSVARAQVVNVGTSQSPDSRLVLTSRTTGVAGALLIGSTGLDSSFSSALGGRSTVTTARNARIEIGTGQFVERSTNTLSDVFDGLTVQLTAADPDAVVDIDVARDTTGMTSKIKEWVGALNASLALIDSKSAYNAASKTAGVLQGDSGARQLRQTLVQGTRTEVPGAEISSLAQLGIITDRTGKYTVDDARLAAALADDPAAVAAVFARSATATNSAVSFVGATESTQAGTFAVAITHAATAATALGNATTASGEENLTFTIGSLIASVQLSGGLTVSEAAATLNIAFAQRGLGLKADVSAGVLRVRSLGYGAAARFSVRSDRDAADGVGIGGTTAGDDEEYEGTDVAGTIGGVAALGAGQLLTASSGAASGLKLRIDTDTPGALGDVTYRPGAGGGILQAIGASGGVDGILQAATNSIDSTKRANDDRIDAMQRRLEATQLRLRKQFSQMESLLSQMRAQGDRLSSALANGVYSS